MLNATQEEERLKRRTFLFFFLGFLLLAVALLTPQGGSLEGRSMYQVAWASPWQHFFDWPAAWCSVKIILLCLGLALVLVYLARLLRNFGRPALAWFILGCSILPGAGLLAGFFLLLKAIF
jgi:ABC-type Fe3+ transport system permease subunit